MKLLGSFSFRLALLYLGLFTASVSALLGLYYWTAIRQPLEAAKAEIRSEVSQLAELRDQRGTEGLVGALDERARKPSRRRSYHALISTDGSTLTSTLPTWPPAISEGWLRLEADVYRDGAEYDHEALVLERRLSDGARLLVGRDIEDLAEIEEGIKDAAIWVLPTLLMLGTAGGALMSRAIGRRLEAVDVAARRVMDGDLSQRVAVRGTGDDLDRLGETLNLMLARIEASLEAVRRVSDSVAHELRTPLARLQADMRELEVASPEDYAAIAARASSEAERLGTMFDAVLRVSRIESGRHAIQPLPVDLSALLEDASELYGPIAEEKGLTLELDTEPGLTVAGDRDLLFQATSNLIDNSVKFTPEGGRIHLRVRELDGEVALSVVDSGPGISEPDRLKVTERFFRSRDVADVPGFGLGLTLVQAVAAVHRSRLRFFDAHPGLGIEWVFLPLNKPEGILA